MAITAAAGYMTVRPPLARPWSGCEKVGTGFSLKSALILESITSCDFGLAQSKITVI